MATVYQYLAPSSAILPDTNAPSFHYEHATAVTNPPIQGLAFAGVATDEDCYFYFLARNYGSGNLTVTVYWSADTATTGDVKWGAAIAVTTPNTDPGAMESETFGAAATVTDTAAATAGRMYSTTITVSALESLAADDHVILHFYRDASDTVNDTMAGDAYLLGLEVSYSDT